MGQADKLVCVQLRTVHSNSQRGGLSPICAAAPWQNALTGRSKEVGQLWKPFSVAGKCVFFFKIINSLANMQRTNIHVTVIITRPIQYGSCVLCIIETH